ncbi:general odorant-binding protein 57a [Drosophila takahashii]|uniref:general odorant-binding protein 57a n=1 Tax=Drosophila takahashii TaxID=29030 RepID=UPI001CF85056|nr:general odorant-binding protein 57a [Drosophila takahashii]
MFVNRLEIFALLTLALMSRASANHPFDFFEGTLDDFDDCLEINNITIEEYEKFEEFENLDNVLSENVKLKYKCNIKCQLEREPTKWLNDLGKIDVGSMNATSEAAESITKCMDQASKEPCAYAFKLVICAFKSGHSVIEFESYDRVLDETSELASEQQSALDESDIIDVV